MVEANASWDKFMLHGGVSRAPENVGEWSAGFFPVPDGGIFVPHCSSPEMRILGPWVRIKDKIDKILLPSYFLNWQLNLNFVSMTRNLNLQR